MNPKLLPAPLLGIACLAVGCDLAGNASTGAPAPVATVKPQPVATTPPNPAQPDRALVQTFDDIKFDIEPDAPFERDMLTPEIEALNGRRITIRGWMLPTAMKRGIKQFVLVRDNQECCFGPGAALYDCILVEMQGGATAEFSIYSITVTGEFRIEEFPGPEGRPLAIYQMRGGKAE